MLAMQEWKPEFGPLEHRLKMGFTGSEKDKPLIVLALEMQRQEDFWDLLANQLRLNCSLVGDAISQDRVKSSQGLSPAVILCLPHTLISMFTYIHIRETTTEYNNI